MNALADPRVAPGILSPLGPIVFIFMQYSGKKKIKLQRRPFGRHLGNHGFANKMYIL